MQWQIKWNTEKAYFVNEWSTRPWLYIHSIISWSAYIDLKANYTFSYSWCSDPWWMSMLPSRHASFRIAKISIFGTIFATTNSCLEKMITDRRNQCHCCNSSRSYYCLQIQSQNFAIIGFNNLHKINVCYVFQHSKQISISLIKFCSVNGISTAINSVQHCLEAMHSATKQIRGMFYKINLLARTPRQRGILTTSLPA